MKKSEINFPVPVLNGYNSDYAENCSFSITVDEIKEEGHCFKTSVSYCLNCEGLQKKVDNKEAVVIIKLHCSTTSYRFIEMFEDGNNIVLRIPKKDVINKVELVGYILAKQKIEKFCLPEHNPMFFGGIALKAKKGTVLAESDTIPLFVDGSELEKQLSSIIKIDNVSGIEHLCVDYDDQISGLIHIKMPSDEYDEYFALRKKYNRFGVSRFLQSAVIMPALVEAITLLKLERTASEYDDEYEVKYSSTVWAESIISKCDELGRDIYDETLMAYTLANEILGFVTKDAVRDLYGHAQGNYNNNEAIRIGGID